MAAIDVAREVLKWFASQDPRVEATLAGASVTISQVTSSGFFASVDSAASADPLSRDSTVHVLDGCGVFAPDLPDFADCLLHLCADGVHRLEVYSVSGGNPADAEVFEVRPITLNRIDQR